MKNDILDLIDFSKVDTLLEGFNKSTGFVTAILDLDGNILSKSGWRQICTEFHRINPETSKKCTISDTELANKIGEGEKYYFYKCLNGLVDVAVPIIINGEHIANLFSGQFFFEEPDGTFFKKQAEKYGFDEVKYMAALKNVPVVSQEKVKTAMDFLQNMTQMISEMTFQKLEQIELNKNIRESEENLSITLHSIGDGVITTDKSGMINRMNPVALKLCGWQADEIKGKSLTEVFNIIDVYTREPVLNPVERVIENGEIVGLANHTVLVAKDGKEYQIADSAAPIKDKDGNIMGVVLVFSDVSEKYAAEEERRKSDERFRIAQEMSPDGFTILHPVRDAQNRVIDFTWIYENDAIARLNGTDPQKVVGLCLLELFPEHRDSQFFKAYQQVAESGESITFEEGYASESMQKQTWFRIVVVPMGENIAVLAQDITDRKQAEEIKKELLIRFELISNHLPGVIYQFRRRTDGSFHFPYASPGIFKIYGVHPKDVEHNATTAFKAIHPDDFEQVSLSINHSAQTLTPWHDVYRVNQPSGKTIWVEGNSTPQKLEDESIIWHGYIQDITDRKQAENALLAKVDELERFHQLTVGREITMVELKKEVNNLLKKIGEDPKYKIVQ